MYGMDLCAYFLEPSIVVGVTTFFLYVSMLENT